MKNTGLMFEFIAGSILLLWGIIEQDSIMTIVGAWAVILYKIDWLRNKLEQ